jgi:hypothetical protein
VRRKAITRSTYGMGLSSSFVLRPFPRTCRHDVGQGLLERSEVRQHRGGHGRVLAGRREAGAEFFPLWWLLGQVPQEQRGQVCQDLASKPCSSASCGATARISKHGSLVR